MIFRFVNVLCMGKSILKVKEVQDDTVIIDFNHPLAGKDLMFTVTINNVRDASVEEAMSGIPAENKMEESGCCGSGGNHGCGCH